ncbi:amino acid permease [Modestobacter muralis]|uniref:Amino acid permease n=1 Tax=Modestobacter muralis TaxID=1608614 RepID=A0A6P0EYT5_9ACTN|nr:amino acid permease [Modestobacter muralis]NEN51316.1 amino acid permease [Modestobacter muralis]
MSEQVRDTTANEGTALERAISGKLLYVFILGDVLGAGIYALVGEIAGEVGGAIWVPMLVALLLALLTAASYAELVTKYPRAGGSAVFAERAFGRPVVSFLVGYCMLAAGVVSAAGLSLAFAGDYLSVFLDVPAVPAAVVFLAVIALVNARGIKESMRANLVMTVIEVSGLVLVIVLGAIVFGRGDGDVGRVVQFPEGVSAGSAVLAAAILAYYSFVGFETSANVAEEVRDVSRVYPRALFGALLTAGVVYVAIGLVASIVLPTEELAGSTGPLLEVVRATGLGVPDQLFSAIALIAVANGALLTMIMASRMVFGLAEQRLLPPVLGAVLPGRRTPWVAIVVTTVVAMALTLIGDLGALANIVVLLLLLVFVSTNLSVLVLRRDRVEHEHFTAPAVLPVLAIGSCLLLLWEQEATTWLWSAVLLAAGVVLYLLAQAPWWRGDRSRESGSVRAD